MAAMTRGPLTSSVYWRRRLVVLTVAIVLVWGIAHLLGGGGGSTTGSSVSPGVVGPLPGPGEGVGVGVGAGVGVGSTIGSCGTIGHWPCHAQG